MRRILGTIAALLVAVAAASANDIEGQLAVCESCHAATSAARVGPRLAGQKVDYLRKQLLEFRSGARVDAQMSPMAKPLSDAQIAALAQHYASLPGPKPTAPTLDPTTRPLVFCVRCHGPSGVSPNELWPSLAGLDVAYMRKQIAAFSHGERRDDMMSSWGRMIQGEDMERILEYFSRLGK